MSYVILTEKVGFKRNYPEPNDNVFYSHVYGCFSKANQATRFETFEDTQSTVMELRERTNYFISAIEYNH